MKLLKSYVSCSYSIVNEPYPVCHQELGTSPKCLQPLPWNEMMVVMVVMKEGKQVKGQEVELWQDVTGLYNIVDNSELHVHM